MMPNCFQNRFTAAVGICRFDEFSSKMKSIALANPSGQHRVAGACCVAAATPGGTRREDESTTAILCTDEMMLHMYCCAMAGTLPCRWLSNANWNAIVITALELAAAIDAADPAPWRRCFEHGSEI
ncbi:Os06g0722600 [Oryza sativa Japonica Group]|uniref:Os06g0720601 protein n=1 Tax=Oryza sativa subsp. japonica TaxID=39947 RepID=A0A0P0X128_ORYSJ|nr:hypothetical protein EE612_036521 [Oryza sativa]KAB8103926.1 hypothetical protein EE612_036521 [Oryza sativa]BAS99540.1 Os06g0720601 [Oryza sativa Japonica Group]BAS99553.1 Os06g0722201 [Oryza sativa Japonica Group]BAS99557.1 Os06g0722600 [Oryza sativa Japonica Group]